MGEKLRQAIAKNMMKVMHKINIKPIYFVNAIQMDVFEDEKKVFGA